MSAQRQDPGVSEGMRERLGAIADSLIPAAHGMPGAREVGVEGRQLDRVLAARPDLEAPLLRALQRVRAERHDELLAELEELGRDDALASEALLQTVVGAYYMHPDVRRRLRYDGQVPVEVRPEIIPNYVEEGLLDSVLERGPIYRTVPEELEESR